MCPCNFISVFNILKGVNDGNQKFEVREFNYGCVQVTKNFLLNYSLFKIIVKPSRKVEFSSEKQKDMSDDGTKLSALRHM